MKTKTDGKNVTITHEYDIRNRLKKVLYPQSRYVQYTSDNNGNRLTMVDTRLDIGDETFPWEYDALGNLVMLTYPGGTTHDKRRKNCDSKNK